MSKPKATGKIEKNNKKMVKKTVQDSMMTASLHKKTDVIVINTNTFRMIT